ncbi:unnamed protein product [Fusarium langsethiae]|nr:unnamed protein product [Fusarium langsethiae]
MATNACEEVHPNIVDLISSYTILSSIAPWLSTLDLHNLSLTNRSAYTSIHSSDKIFNFLARQSLCDGRGLAVRQAFKGSYHPNPMPGRWDINPHLSGDEEIEVYLYNVKCIEAEALPCIKCGINTTSCVYLCEECDNKTEEEVIDKFVNQRCDCDIYTRWICVRCEDEERKTTKKYFAERTQMEWDWIVRYDVDFGDDCEPSKTLHDHAFERASHDAFGADDDICRKLIGIRNIVTLVRSIRSLTTTQIIRDG